LITFACRILQGCTIDIAHIESRVTFLIDVLITQSELVIGLPCMIASISVSGIATTADSAKTGADHFANKAEKAENIAALNRRFITTSLA